MPADSIWRDPQGNLASFKAPVMQSIVAIIFMLCAVTGIVYGIISGKFRSSKDFTHSMEEITKTLVQLIVFYFFAAQFIYAFGASNLGALIAVSGAEFLKSLALRRRLRFSGSSSRCPPQSAHHIGIGKMVYPGTDFRTDAHVRRHCPGTYPAAFRVSDSAVNVCTPMFAFYPLIIIYCQKYYKKTGVGTLSSMMLPYTGALLVALTIMLYLFWWFNIPLGFQADYVYPRQMF